VQVSLKLVPAMSEFVNQCQRKHKTIDNFTRGGTVKAFAPPHDNGTVFRNLFSAGCVFVIQCRCPD